jgi:integrase
MSEITMEHVEAFMVGLRKKKLGGVRCNKARALLSRIVQRAVRNKWLDDNPVLEVRREREPKAKIDPLTFEEVKRLLDSLAGDPEMQRLFTVAIFSGLRTSELLGLRWDDIDWKAERPVANISQAVTKLDGTHGTKTPGSERTIDLRPKVVAALKAQRAASLLKSEFVFPSETGGPLDRDNLSNRTWLPALKRGGLRRRTQYQCRHSFATLALNAGEAIGWVAAQLGHTDISMVIKHYYRWVKNPARQDGSQFDREAAAAGL